MTQTARGGSSAATSSSRELAPSPPSAFSASIGPGVRLLPTTRWPSRRSRRAMFPPIRPRPTMPSCMGESVATRAPFRQHPVNGSRRLPVAIGGYALLMEQADALVVFGITGDLARRMTLPALYRLTEQEILTCSVVSVGRRPLGDGELADLARQAVTEAVKDVDERVLDDLLNRLAYVAGAAEDPALYEQLREKVGEARAPVFYLAVPPASFLPVAEGLAAAGLVDNARLVVEKPFGTDLHSARELNERLTAIVPEARLYRIDHFLGKEPVQDIVYFRFANALFEPVWSREDVDSIQITLAEDFGVEGRGAFYDRVGAIRDVVQNHLLQVLALAAMEPPSGGDDALARRRLDVFRAMPPVDTKEVVRGQYEGYRQIEGVRPDSDTETFVALRLSIENWRWA